MNLIRINIILGILLLVLTVVVASIDVDHSQPNVEFIPEMKRSPASAAFAANTVFPNGRTLQAPVFGTIARGDLPLYYKPTKEDAVRAGEELLNPFAVTETINSDVNKSNNHQPELAKDNSAPTSTKKKDGQTVPKQPKPDPRAKRNASIERGAKIYGVFCVSCHGPKGAGDGPVAKRGFPPPPPLTTGKSVQMKDGQLFHLLTYGQGSMSSMAAQLTRTRRWDAINYVRSIQHAAKPNQAQKTSNPASQPAKPKAPDKPTPSKENRP